MMPDELFDALDGLFAFDVGCTDSGIHDEMLKAKVKQVLEAEASKPENECRKIPLIIEQFCIEYAVKEGYGLEDVIEFLKWLEELMGWDLL